MGLTIGSVKNHILQLHKICGVHTTRELLRVLVTENLVTVEECPALEYLPQRGRHILDLLSQGNSRPQVAHKWPTSGDDAWDHRQWCKKTLRKVG